MRTIDVFLKAQCGPPLYHPPSKIGVRLCLATGLSVHTPCSGALGTDDTERTLAMLPTRLLAGSISLCDFI